MKREMFKNIVNWGDTTAFVYDSPRNRYQYTSGEVSREVLEYTTPDTKFDVVPINTLPEVKEVMLDNLLAEMSSGEERDTVEAYIEHGLASVACWTENDPDQTRAYMLMLLDEDVKIRL